MANEAPITLEQLFRYWRDLPHQRAAIPLLEADLKANGYATAMRRDRDWFKVWGTAGKQSDLSSALSLIKEFEGCALTSYPDPLSGGAPWTIGFGSTRYPDGRPVQQGDKITAIEADLMLRQEVDRIGGKLCSVVPYWSSMNDAQRSALISFAFNLGDAFYGSAGFETISQRLREKDWAKVPDALLLYRNPGSNVEAGLKRRREAEGRLWLRGLGLPEPQQSRPKTNPLSVPYYSQRDSSTQHALRMCFSSSCAMLLETLRPGTLKGPNGDDAYLNRVLQYGDTTDSASQISALQSFGVKAGMTHTANWSTITQQIDRGIPVPIGILHKGPVTAPVGGGHWICVIGYTDDEAVIVHDPFGDLDLVSGNYSSNAGAKLRYSKRNLGPRWMVEGANTGWAILATAP
jgi:GH24 family phage-related lysozyme (muramidase)